MLTKTCFTLSAIALGMTASVAAKDGDFIQHDSHQHGVVEWHMAQDGNDFLVEITAPGSDIVGFEHAPENDAQEAAILKAIDVLKKPGTLVALNASADCKLVEALVTQTLDKHDDHKDHDHGAHASHDDHHDEHADHDDHKDHDHDAHASHDEHHDEHADHDDHKDHDHDAHASHEEHHDEHAGHDDHKGHDHDEHEKSGSSHGEFSAQYTYNCGSPADLETAVTDWFTVFEKTEKISVQAITDKGVLATELTSKSNTIRF
ncbi:zinc uptake protein ZrgA [Enterovibrio calviensis]|uniref:zinc uptake protein ZrgA n=1 Tax=Enterovibrio calviensis TaxID=91359 RepID=UPI0004836875|nr:DUF2796 domain-containing protein [Enterovibrio calviensis]